MSKSEYREKIAQLKANAFPKPPPPVRNCASCEHLDDDGMCEKMGEYPPLDFLTKQNECADYYEDLPF